MGLDMYLSAKRYSSEYTDTEFHAKMESYDFGLKPMGGNFSSYEIKIPVAYWRKANQIHKWFVDHVQEGNDDCGYYHVSREQLEELVNTCAEALLVRTKKNAHRLLPPQEGFFFGNMSIDAWYWDQVQYTVDTLQAALKATAAPDGGFSPWDFEYHSSW